MAIKRVGREDSNIDAIERALGDMLVKLNRELENVVTAGAINNANKTNLETILSEIDNQIINNASIRAYLLGDNVANRARVSELIQDVQDAVREKIDEFKDPSKGVALSEDAAKEVEEVFENKVVGSETVTRTKVLDEYRAKATTIGFDSAESRYSATDIELKDVEAKLAKIAGLKTIVKPGEKVEDVIDTLASNAGKFKLDEKYIATIKSINEKKYDYKANADELAVEHFNYSVTENAQKVSEFLTELYKLKEGNPEIEAIFAELSKVKINVSKGKFELKSLSKKQRGTLVNVLNKGLKSKPIDFDKAKSNTYNALLQKADAEMDRLLSTDFIKLYPNEMKKWSEDRKDANPSEKISIWYDMTKFLKAHDFEVEFDEFKELSKEEADLLAKKDTLTNRAKGLHNIVEGEKFESVADELHTLDVDGILIESKKDLMKLVGNNKEMDNASRKLYEKVQKEFEEKFYAEADEKDKKVGIFERIGYAISHRTLQPKKAIMAERIENWSRSKIAAAMTTEIAKTTGAVVTKEAGYKNGALTPEQLREVREKQARVLETRKKEQERAIVEGTVKDADEASKNARKKAEEDMEK